MAFALGLGLLASLAFFVSANVYAFAASFVAGMSLPGWFLIEAEAWSDWSSELLGPTPCGAPTR